jgi:cytoskeletal protein CcmA (bactofilin family)
MKKPEKGVQTFLGSHTTLEGDLVFEGSVRIDGHLTGSVESKDGEVIIGETAVVHADIIVESATVSGEVRGNIRAKDRIALHPPARVFGDMSAPEVFIDVGVVFDGKCNTVGEHDGVIKAIPFEPKQ